MAPKQTYFSKLWMTDRTWLQEVKDNKTMAFCDVCKKTLMLGNMGEVAIIKHGKGQKHLDKLKSKSSSNSIEDFIKSTKNLRDQNQSETLNLAPGN